MLTIQTLWFDGGRIYILASDDKVYSRPLEAFPTLFEADDAMRLDFEICLHGTAVRWKALDEDVHITNFFDTEEPDYTNEVACIFRRFPQLNVSEVARSMGINKSLLSKYIYGVKRPSPERLEAIKATLCKLGQELVNICS